MSNIDLVAQYIREDDLRNIPGKAQIQIGRGMDGDGPELTSSSDNRQGFRLRMPCERGRCDCARRGQTFELLADIRHLLVYPLLF